SPPLRLSLLCIPLLSSAAHRCALHSFPTRRSSDLPAVSTEGSGYVVVEVAEDGASIDYRLYATGMADVTMAHIHVGAEGENGPRSEEHTSELQSRENLVCRLLLEKKN